MKPNIKMCHQVEIDTCRLFYLDRIAVKKHCSTINKLTNLHADCVILNEEKNGRKFVFYSCQFRITYYVDTRIVILPSHYHIHTQH